MIRNWRQKESRFDSMVGELSRRLRICVNHGEGWRFCLEEMTSERSQKGSTSSGGGRGRVLKERENELALWWCGGKEKWMCVIEGEGCFSSRQEILLITPPGLVDFRMRITVSPDSATLLYHFPL